ncbi:hypothetical protein HCO69_19645 [Pantoea sp. LS15]|uniref:type II secretion system protein N n=1 Tax=Enterobacterales TaxID=91347 RepID=UPI000E0FDB89|nr:MULTISPECIES: type II secretion system protein N [Enterobacterales]NJQ21827.1 hypothetical protein [Pantoea sp. LS15]NKF48423.1 hypothetical protein [Pantoea sp. LS15]RDK12980.1 hypothetical protein CEJ32_20105 [Enterobacter sp. 9-2]
MMFSLRFFHEIREDYRSFIPSLLWFVTGGGLLFTLGNISLLMLAEPVSARLPPLSDAYPVQYEMPALSLFQEAGAWSRFHIDAIALSSPEIKDAPASALKLKVTGILYHHDAKKSVAIVESNKQQTMLQAGDPLPGTDAEIALVLNDRIIIAHQGKYESIAIERDIH